MSELSGSTRLNILLTEMKEAQGFPISVLTDAQGLTVAWAAEKGMDPDRQSAVVAFAQKTAIQVGKQLGMAEADEVSFYDTSGQRLVCRPFSVDGHALILAVIVPDRAQSYRRATNHAVSEISRIFKKFWE